MFKNRMCSKSFATHKVREISRKEERESKDFPVLWMGIIENVLQMEGKKCKDQVKLKIGKRKSMPERGRYFSMGSQTLSGPAAVDEERLVAAARNLVEER